MSCRNRHVTADENCLACCGVIALAVVRVSHDVSSSFCVQDVAGKGMLQANRFQLDAADFSIPIERVLLFCPIPRDRSLGRLLSWVDYTE